MKRRNDRIIRLSESRAFWAVYLLAMYAAIFGVIGFLIGRFTA